jgi:hypothetical protein
MLATATSFAAHPSAAVEFGTPLHNGIPAFSKTGVDHLIVIDEDAAHINVEGGQRV